LDQPTYSFLSFPGKIHLINTDQELSAVASELAAAKELGFDTETRPAFKKGEVYQVALLQLSTETDAYVIRLHHVQQFEIFKDIFENPNVVKVGVAIRDDLKQLKKRFQFEPANFIELQDLAKVKGLKNFGLKGMTEEVLNATITKGPKTTNWEAPVFTDRQIMYAATDAWIGLKLYQKLSTYPAAVAQPKN
jgi:ribonuclease D